MHIWDKPEIATNDLLCVYYETCQAKNCLHENKQLPERCPISKEAPKCFCLTERELNLFCSFVDTLQNDKPITFFSDSVPLPVVDAGTVQKYIPVLSKCAIEYRTRSGNIVTTDEVRDTYDVVYLRELLLQTYVVYHIIDLNFQQKGNSLDDEWNGTLLEMLAGFLYYNATYAEKYFRKVANLIVDRKDDCLIKEINKIIAAMNEWHYNRNLSRKKANWGQQTGKALNTTEEIQASVIYYFESADDYDRLQWDTQEVKPVQWAMHFIRIMQSMQQEHSWLSCRKKIREIL